MPNDTLLVLAVPSGFIEDSGILLYAFELPGNAGLRSVSCQYSCLIGLSTGSSPEGSRRCNSAKHLQIQGLENVGTLTLIMGPGRLFASSHDAALWSLLSSTSRLMRFIPSLNGLVVEDADNSVCQACSRPPGGSRAIVGVIDYNHACSGERLGSPAEANGICT